MHKLGSVLIAFFIRKSSVKKIVRISAPVENQVMLDNRNTVMAATQGKAKKEKGVERYSAPSHPDPHKEIY